MQKTLWLCMESVDCMTYRVIRVIKRDNKLCERMWTQFSWWFPVTAAKNGLFS